MDPLVFKEINWPEIYFHKKQKEVIYSAINNDETFVMGCNECGKSLLSAFVAVYWICTVKNGRVVVTSVKLDQLRDVIWGEITRLISTAKTKLPLQCNFLHIKKLDKDGNPVPSSELVGQVSNTQEGILGRHASEGWAPTEQSGKALTFVIGEEASGIQDHVRNSTLTWADRRLWISNTWNCENFFRYATDEDYTNDKGIPGGKDIPRESGNGFHRKIIRIDSFDNPNIAYGLEEEKRGLKPSGKIFIPGIKTFDKFKEDQILLDEMMVNVVLWAKYYKGKELKLYPNEWIDRAKELFYVHNRRKRRAKAIGIDPGEGVSKTSLCAVDEYGILEIVSVLTPDTSVIDNMIIDFGRKHNVPSHMWGTDRGGGGKQIADRLRRAGYNIRTIAFGQSIQEDPKRGSGQTPYGKKIENVELKYAFTTFRAMLYGTFAELLDPSGKPTVEELKQYEILRVTPQMGFSIPPTYHTLFQEMRAIPKIRDDNGRLWIPPKGNKDLPDWVPQKSRKTLIQLVGHSPDELDSVVVAVYVMNNSNVKRKAGAPS